MLAPELVKILESDSTSLTEAIKKTSFAQFIQGSQSEIILAILQLIPASEEVILDISK